MAPPLASGPTWKPSLQNLFLRLLLLPQPKISINLLDFCFLVGVDLAIQVAGSGEALKDREGEMVEKRMLVHRVFHFGNLGGTKQLNLHLNNSKVTLAR